MDTINIINTGGTFNKDYDEINGKLIVNKTNKYIKQIINKSKIHNINIKGMIYKDSLDITNDDRQKLLNYIQKTKIKKIIIVHGTDTIDKTALFLAKYIKNKTIILTGAMKPFSIDPVEATSNLMSAYGFLQNDTKNDVYICMHGIIKKYTKIKKNKKLGIFEINDS